MTVGVRPSVSASPSASSSSASEPSEPSRPSARRERRALRRAVRSSRMRAGAGGALARKTAGASLGSLRASSSGPPCLPQRRSTSALAWRARCSSALSSSPSQKTRPRARGGASAEGGRLPPSATGSFSRRLRGLLASGCAAAPRLCAALA